MDAVSVSVVCVVVAGLAFDFVNGFHDAANSIATIVATKVLTPRQAVLWAAFFNVVAVFFFGTAVAHMVGAGLVDLAFVTPLVVLCGLIGAVAWGLMTWWWGLPTSSSHALLGGYAGAAMMHSALQKGWQAAGDPILTAGWLKVFAFIVIAPLIGLMLAQILMHALTALGRRFHFNADNRHYRQAQLASSAFLSLMHGSNDAQKTAGIIASALTAAGIFQTFTVPLWILVISYSVMGLGTLVGGWRIVHTMGHRLTHINAQGGVCAEGAAALSILVATLFGLPISTTHVTTGSILGVGVATDARKVRWTVARRIAWAWILTIPSASFIGGCVMAWASLIPGKMG